MKDDEQQIVGRLRFNIYKTLQHTVHWPMSSLIQAVRNEGDQIIHATLSTFAW